jgi:phage-related protein
MNELVFSSSRDLAGSIVQKRVSAAEVWALRQSGCRYRGGAASTSQTPLAER